MNILKEIMPYIATVLAALISGWLSYSASVKNSKTELESVKLANKHDLEKLMEQHKLDIDALEKKHQMDIEKLNLAHAHELELKQMEINSRLGGDFLKEVMKMPEVRQELTNGIKQSNRSRKK